VSSQEEFIGEAFIIADNYILIKFICLKHPVKRLYRYLGITSTLGGWWIYNWNLSGGDGVKLWQEGYITNWIFW
jgi:hypothetical protein